MGARALLLADAVVAVEDVATRTETSVHTSGRALLVLSPVVAALRARVAALLVDQVAGALLGCTEN